MSATEVLTGAVAWHVTDSKWKEQDVPFAKDVIENQRATNILHDYRDLADLYHGAKWLSKGPIRRKIVLYYDRSVGLMEW
jgi:hypothetical protein